MLSLIDRTLPPGSPARRRIRIALFWMLIPIALNATAVDGVAQAMPSPPPANAFFDRVNSQPLSESKAALQLRLMVDFVLVPVTVTKANGIAVTNLAKGEFALFDVISEFTAPPRAFAGSKCVFCGEGSTALLDAIYFGLDRMQEAHY